MNRSGHTGFTLLAEGKGKALRSKRAYNRGGGGSGKLSGFANEGGLAKRAGLLVFLYLGPAKTFRWLSPVASFPTASQRTDRYSLLSDSVFV